MASKSSLLVLVIVLFQVSSILTIKGRDLPKHSHDDFKFKLGASFTGTGPKSNVSAGKTTSYPMKEGSEYYTHFAGYQSKGAKGNTWWRGVRAQINLWKMQGVKPLSESSAYIAAMNNLNGEEIVVAGVHVYPLMYNNSDLHFFTYWKSTRDDIKGCYNDQCPGFVIANNSNLHPGNALSPLSDYGGAERYITIRIKKDQKTGDWSLYREDKGGPIGGMTLLGWWPQSLFKSLSDRANIIQWSGDVSYHYNETGPSMGSGHVPNESVGVVASFDDCFGFDYDGTLYEDDYNAIPFIDRRECYNISLWYQPPKNSGYSRFYYGGPAGCFK